MSVFSSSFDWFDRYADRKALSAPAKDRDRSDSAAEASDLGDVIPIPQAEPTFDPFNWLLGVGPAQSAVGATPAFASASESLPDASDGPANSTFASDGPTNSMFASDGPANSMFASDWSANSLFATHMAMSPAGSPADQWLNGNEWHGTISSGAVDTSGQGNDVFAVDGEVLSLPT